jgi:uncharacterized protein (DUF697 family)/GTPase SAR1 family protein
VSDSYAGEWLKDSFATAYKEHTNHIGRFNLAIFGKTGVGKSTLINAIFREDVAPTGIGQPVTSDEHLYLHKSGQLGILDTRGLEIGKDSGTILKDLREYLTKMRDKPLEDQLHVAWYCVRATDRRFEDTEAEFVRQLRELGLPVILVMTQVPMNNGMHHPDSIALAEKIILRDLPVHEKKVIMTMALADKFQGQQDHGLIELLDATFRAAPEGAASAINASQKIDYKRKSQEAQTAISTAAAAAAAAGASPIPFSDAVIIVPIQMAMMAAVSMIYGISIDRATTATMAVTAAATAAGRSITTNLIKLVPGFGTVVGGAISAAVASAVTFCMGQAWLIVCQKISRGELAGAEGVLDSEAIRRIFMDEFKQQAKKRMPGGR